MPQRNPFASVFASAKRGLSRLFFGTNDDRALERRKRRQRRLERQARRSVRAAKPAAPRSASIEKSPAPLSAGPQSEIERRKEIPPDYEDFSLAVWHQNIEFPKDPRFLAAYQRGMSSGHQFGDHAQLEWRTYLCCWAASHAKRLPGDFVECGVHTGSLSLAVCEYIDFNATGKKFWLFDTFAGIPEAQAGEGETEHVQRENRRYYFDCWEIAQRNFANYPNAHLIRGIVPETLPQATVEKVCYLSLDMNIVVPEQAAMEYFWPKLVSGAIVVLDDYGWRVYHKQKAAMDDFAARMGTEVLALPTGQGLIIKA